MTIKRGYVILQLYSVKPDTNISLSRALRKVKTMKHSRLTRLLAVGLLIAFAIASLAFTGCSNKPADQQTPVPNNTDDSKAAHRFIPSDVTIDISDDGTLTDSEYGISIRDNSPWLIGYNAAGEKIIEQKLPDEFLDVSLIRVKLWDAEKLRITCTGYEETLKEWNDMSQKTRGKLPCLFYYQSAGVYCMFNATYSREFSVICEDGTGVFVGFDDVYKSYTPAEGETMAGGFDATHLNIMEGTTMKESIMNNYENLEDHAMQPVL